MIRPQRRFIIPRTTSLVSAKAPVRLVRITRSQSSSDMRASRLSAVIAGVVDQDVDRREVLGQLLEPLAEGLRAGVTSSTSGRAQPPPASIARRQLLELVLVAGREHHARALLREPAGDGLADPLGGAGHQRRLAVQSEHQASFFSRCAASGSEPECSSLSSLRSWSGSDRPNETVPGAIRRFRPSSTLPGPISRNRSHARPCRPSSAPTPPSAPGCRSGGPGRRGRRRPVSHRARVHVG